MAQMPTRKPFPPENRSAKSRKALIRSRLGIAKTMRGFFRSQAPKIAKWLAKRMDLAKTDDDNEKKAKRLAAEAPLDFTPIVDDLEAYISVAATTGAADAVASFGLDEDALGSIRAAALDFAHERAAEMVGMQWFNGELIENPDAYWRIDQTTRDGLQSLIVTALDEGQSTGDLANAIQDSYSFSDARADVIARTEIAKADSEGAVAGWRESGQVDGKEWVTAGDDLVSDDCQENEDAGQVPIDHDYGDGVLAPPQHPNCRCVVMPVLIEEDSSNGE